MNKHHNLFRFYKKNIKSDNDFAIEFYKTQEDNLRSTISNFGLLIGTLRQEKTQLMAVVLSLGQTISELNAQIYAMNYKEQNQNLHAYIKITEDTQNQQEKN